MQRSDIMERISLNGFIDGSLQEGAEDAIKYFIPAKKSALLGYAALQRTAISTSNIIFNWPAYPTFYGSGFVVYPDANMLLVAAEKETEENNKAASEFIHIINELQQKYPEVRFVYQSMNDMYTSTTNPTNVLTNGNMNKSWHETMIVEALDDRVVATIESIDNAEDLSNNWFSAEHHWNISGALKAYNHIAEILGLKAYDDEDQVKIIEEWQGANARAGLDLDFPSQLWDVPTDFSNLEITLNGQLFTHGARELLLVEHEREGLNADEALDVNTLLKTDALQLPTGAMNDQEAYFNAYHWYYGTSTSNVIYENTGEHNGKTLLYICQSYGVPIERYLASNYTKTIVLSPALDPVNKTLDEYIAEYDVDDVVLQFGAHPYSVMHNVSPAIFKLAEQA